MTTYIYVIASKNEGPSKIGLSKNPKRRLQQLQTAHPEKLFLYHQEEFETSRARLIEECIHRTIRHKRSSGEWFNIGVDEAKNEIVFAKIRYEDDDMLQSSLKMRLI
jgi:predicted GIY-YIG superfamily endonuclease